MALASVLFLGFLLGMRHALEADHLAAVATLATRSTSVAQTIRQGAFWGLGHTITLMVFGGAVMALGLAIPERTAQILELLVGCMLVFLGVDLLLRLRRERVHFHGHGHGDGTRHFHAHSHAGEGAHAASVHQHEHRRWLPPRALAVGMVHGLAGSAALVLLTIETVGSPAIGFAYIALFGAGSILGMAALSAVIALPLRATAKRLENVYTGLSLAVGVGTLGLGLVMVWELAPAILA